MDRRRRGLTVDGKDACGAHTKGNETGLVSEETDMMRAAMTHGTDAVQPDFVLGHLTTLAAREAVAASPKERVVLSVAMFSTFLECLELGHGDEARQVMAQLHNDSRVLELVAA